jgi:hypothetical protein
VVVAGRAGMLHELEWVEGEERFLTADATARGWKLHLSARTALVPRPLFLRLLAGVEVLPGGLGAQAGAPARPSALPTSPQGLVRAVYLRPTDWPERPDYSLVIGKAFQHVQLWFQDQVGGGATFALHDPIVEALNTGHDSAWYSTNAVPGTDPSLYFWRNVLADAFALTPGQFWDPSNRWIYYIGAGSLCGQIGGAGTSGVSVLPINDLKGLTRQRGAWPCPSEQWVDYSVCRWVGGLAHELAHSLDVPHPPGCEDSDSATPCPDTLMYWGYLAYPDTGLLESEKAILRSSTFFDVQVLRQTRFGCTKLFSAPGW